LERLILTAERSRHALLHGLWIFLILTWCVAWPITRWVAARHAAITEIEPQVVRVEALESCQGSNAACSLALKPDGGAIKRHLSPDTTPVSAQISPATQGLIERRLAALRQALSDKAWWDPYLRAPQTELQDNSPELITHVLMPWVAGFEQALEAFPLVAVNDHDELAAMLVQARVYRHLPALDEQEREVADLLNQTFPLESLEDAVDELTACLAELWDLTRGTTAPQSD
jgi:hypothetical protein